MTMPVDVVVLSDAPKDLGSNVEVVVGLPDKDPWTLPFAHKAIFARRVDQYDLFIYTEDDIGVDEGNIHAFMRATPRLHSDEIAGFLRYEVGQDGKRLLVDAWGHYHWNPASVRQRDGYIVAEFTNEHAGFYILMQAQLKRAIASGGYLHGPSRGRYSLPETAATTPYTHCGFRKVLCISALEEFLVHHMPNRYADGLPVTLAGFKGQIQTLLEIQGGRHPARTLCDVESGLWPTRWQKSYYEQPGPEWLIPPETATVLSIGCGWGYAEEKWMRRGMHVTAIPLDSVIGVVAERRGIKVIHGTWEESFRALRGCSFDTVILSNLLHLQQSPEDIVERAARFVREGGSLVLSGINFERIPWRLRRICGIGEFRKLRSFDRGGICLCGPKSLGKCIARAGLRIADTVWLNHAIDGGLQRWNGISLGQATAREWVLRAERSASRKGTVMEEYTKNGVRGFLPEWARSGYRTFRTRLLSLGLEPHRIFSLSAEERNASSMLTMVIAVHDSPSVTLRCLNSLERFGGDAEVVIVDDGSMLESTRSMLERISERTGWRLLRHANALGHSRACEAGAAVATRPYICLLNSDTIVTQRSWLGIVRAFEASSQIAAVGPSTSQTVTAQVVTRAMYCRHDWSDGQICSFAENYVGKHRGNPVIDLPRLGGFAFFVRRDIWEKTGGFSKQFEDYGNETEFCERLRRLGYRLVWSRESYIHHLGSASYGRVLGLDEIRMRGAEAELRIKKMIGL